MQGILLFDLSCLDDIYILYVLVYMSYQTVDVLRHNAADMVPTNIMGNAFKMAGMV